MPNKKEKLPYSETCTTKISESKLLITAVTLSEKLELHAHYEAFTSNYNNIISKIRK
jgi:hypothetical protein